MCKFAIFTILSLCLVPRLCEGAEREVLRTVEEIRALKPEEAAKHLPVELEGLLVYCDRLENHAFLLDATGSIFFRPGGATEPNATECRQNDQVRISGVTVWGRFSPSVAGPGTENSATDSAKPVGMAYLGAAPRPIPPLISGDEFLLGTHHDQFVRVRGTIRTRETTHYHQHERVVLGMSVQGVPSLIRVLLPHFTVLPETLLDMPCEVSGIVAGGGDERGRLYDVRLLPPTLSDVRYDKDSLVAAFSQDPRKPGDIMKYDGTRQVVPAPRVRVDGVVTYTIPGKGFYLGHEAEGVWIQTHQTQPVAIGDKVEVVGFPSQEEQRQILGDAIFRIVGKDPLPVPTPIDTREAVAGKHISSLVSVEGKLLDELSHENGRILFLVSGGNRFSTRVPKQASVKLAAPPALGSLLRVSGILEPMASPSPLARDTSSFSLLARSGEDIRVLRSPGWLTEPRLRMLVMAMLALVAGGLLWLWTLRRQVSHQSRVIEVQTQERTLIEERHRIARELHDTLEQQLAGVRYHLNSLNKWADDAPPAIGRAVAATRAMLDHSRDEMRRSVFELRSPILEQDGLVTAIRQSAETISPNGLPVIQVDCNGEERRLGRRIEFHLMRITQEAVTNAVKHAEADLVTVAFGFSETGLEIVVQDDGRGLQENSGKEFPSTHFGMLGIRERCAKIGGSLTVESSPSKGTRIEILVQDKGKTDQ